MKKIDFHAVESVFQQAESFQLLEHQVYGILNAAGVKTPAWYYFARGDTLDPEVLGRIPGNQVVLKVVSPLIQHKSDVGGVRFAAKEYSHVKQTADDMLTGILRRDYALPKSRAEIEASLKGILITESIDYEKTGFGSELLLGIRHTREFGPVVTLGGGGLDVEYMADQLKPGRAQAISAAHAYDVDDVAVRLRSTAVYPKLTEAFRGKPPLIKAEKLREIYVRFLELADHFSAFSDKSEFVIEEMEVNPFVVSRGNLMPLDGMCRFSRNKRSFDSRPAEQIQHLLHPESIAVIGVSRDMNPGHIIVNNIIKAGFPLTRLYVVKPDCKEIEGARCFPDIASLPETVDLLVLSVSAEKSRDIVDETVRLEKAESLILIAGGMAEKAGGANLEEDIRKVISASRSRRRLAPVVNGGNCLGIVSHPGKYDTTFIPGYKIFSQSRLPERSSGLVLISQSGAFMIARMAQMPLLRPRYAVSIGNQIDLTVSDYLHYLKNDPESKVFALYIEGFKPGDGLGTARAVREITQQGKQVVIYKAGRTREGRSATAGHTASVAGDYQVSTDVLKEAGALLAHDIDAFQNMMQALTFLYGRKVKGRRAALISNAGFECVIMSDNLKNSSRLELTDFSSLTLERLSRILEPLGINRLQDIGNPLDTTPVADDDVFSRCVESILQDEHVDCAVVSPLPMTPSLNTLASSHNHEENIQEEGSIGGRLIELFHLTEKPWVVSLDGGRLYYPLARMLERAGVPVFMKSDQAVSFLRQYINQKLKSVE